LSDNPLVSLTKKKTKTAPIAVSTPKSQKVPWTYNELAIKYSIENDNKIKVMN
jgi:hypothetical protein